MMLRQKPFSRNINFFFLALFFYFLKTSLPLYGQTEKKIASPFLLEKIDKRIQYPNGLYTGNLSIRFQNGKNPRHYKFRLYVKGKNRLYYFLNKSNFLVYKLLYSFHKKSRVTILGWDPLRSILHKKNAKNCFSPVLGSGFSFWDLALLPYAGIYSLKKRRKKKKEKRNTDFPQDLIEYPQKDHVVLLLQPLLKSSLYSRMKMRAQEKKIQVLRLDFYGREGLLKKSLYPLHSKSLYNRSEKKENHLISPTSFSLLDFSQKTLSLFIITSYEPREKIKAPLFEPRFLKN